MTEAADKSSVSRIIAAPRASELSAVVACHTFVCALSTRFVSRLALDADVTPAPEHGADVVRAGEELMPAFNLGTLLGLAPLTAAWVLLRVPRGGQELALALRTGACLVVRQIGVEAPLPAGLFASRGVAVQGAFVAGSRIGVDASLAYGLVLDIGRLFSDAELRSAESALRRQRR